MKNIGFNMTYRIFWIIYLETLILIVLNANGKRDYRTKKTLPKNFKYFTNIITPLFLFISFEANLNANFDKFLISDIKITEYKLNSLLFNKLREKLII